jgi:hypothetical protein
VENGYLVVVDRSASLLFQEFLLSYRGVDDEEAVTGRLYEFPYQINTRKTLHYLRNCSSPASWMQVITAGSLSIGLGSRLQVGACRQQDD